MVSRGKLASRKMQVDTAPLPVKAATVRVRLPRHQRPVDGRSSLGRRIRKLANDFASQLGGWPALNDTLAGNVRRAAELTALAEKARASALRNGDVDPIGLVRLEGAASRAVRALQLDRARPSVPQLKPRPYAVDGGT
jgi:hypothetical protein